jgi:hypothetical protein
MADIKTRGPLAGYETLRERMIRRERERRLGPIPVAVPGGDAGNGFFKRSGAWHRARHQEAVNTANAFTMAQAMKRRP